MRLWTLLFGVAIAAAGCEQDALQDEAQDIEEEALELGEEMGEPVEGGPEEQLEQRIDVAEARQDLVEELREMETALGNLSLQAQDPAAARRLGELQAAYDEISRRLDAAGMDPEQLEQLEDDVAELDTDIGTFERELSR